MRISSPLSLANGKLSQRYLARQIFTGDSQYHPSISRYAVDIQANDNEGNVWTFKCSIRKKGHPKLLSKD
jgi:hypothetical protein